MPWEKFFLQRSDICITDMRLTCHILELGIPANVITSFLLKSFPVKESCYSNKCLKKTYSQVTWAMALLWSSRVRQVKFSGGIDGAYFLQMKALVLAGFPTTTTWHVRK